MQISKKDDSVGNLDASSNSTTIFLASFGPGMVGEGDEAL